MGYQQQMYDQEALKGDPRARTRQGGWSRHHTALRAAAALLTLALVWRLHALHRASDGASSGDGVAQQPAVADKTPTAPLTTLGPTFLVLGQMKSGTSALWNYLMAHPDIDAVRPKEPSYFGRPSAAASTLDCSMHSAAGYLTLFRTTKKSYAHLEHAANLSAGELATLELGPGTLRAAAAAGGFAPARALGDFTASHLSCACCPGLFASLSPRLKLVAVLREPLGRAASRMREQRRSERMGFRAAARAAPDLASLLAAEAAALAPCLAEAAALAPVDNEKSGVTIAAGRARALLEAQCLEPSTFLGYSAYAPFLLNWLGDFPPSQLLVLYTDELRDNPRAALRLVEDHLGVTHFDYPGELLATAFNTRHNPGWRQGDGDNERSEAAAPPAERIALGDLAAAAAWLEPYQRQLLAMADAGLIRRPPKGFFEFRDGDD